MTEKGKHGRIFEGPVSLSTDTYRSTTSSSRGIGLVDTEQTILPCLRCGMALDTSPDGTGYVLCPCGAHYDHATLMCHAKPGYYREWIAALSCACGRVDHYADLETVLTTAHRCAAGGVKMLPRSNN